MKKFKCAHCGMNACYGGKDCAGNAYEIKEIIQREENYKIMKAAAFIEGTYYMQKTRLEEIIEFCKIMGYKHLGLAFCIGMTEEARLLADILERNFEVTSVCCKVCGISKDELGLKKIREDRYEATCNPVAQAQIMNEADVDLNIIAGLCIGHDIVFTKNCNAPVTTLIVKDRVMAHNPAGAIYSGYHRKRIISQ